MIITILSPKGGVGKSTTALLLAGYFAKTKVSVAVIDADPRTAIAGTWAGRRQADISLPAAPFGILEDHNHDTILETIDAACQSAEIVIIDVQGTANLLSAFAAAAADLCLIPMRPSALDTEAASAALQMVENAGRTGRRVIPACLLITQTEAAYRTKSHSELRAELAEGNTIALPTELHRRAPFERATAEGRTLYELTPSPQVDKAIANAAAVADETIQFAKENRNEQTKIHGHAATG